MTLDQKTDREQMIEISVKMNAHGINKGTSGNLSICFGVRFLITPSAILYDKLDPEDIVETDWDGKYAGLRRSLEWRSHRDILKNRETLMLCSTVTLFSLLPWRATIEKYRRSFISSD